MFEKILYATTIGFIIYCFILLCKIESLLDKLDGSQSQDELIGIKEIISTNSIKLFILSIIPFIFNLIFGFD